VTRRPRAAPGVGGAVDRTRLRGAAAVLGVSLPPGALDAFEAYAAEIVQWNARLNLTRIVTPEGIAERHFADALAGVPTLECCLASIDGQQDEPGPRPSPKEGRAAESAPAAAVRPTGPPRPRNDAPPGFAPGTPPTLIDVGSGAGLPGLAIAIARTHWRVALLEATGKKRDFLARTIEALRLANATALAARAEDLGQSDGHRETYDVAVARAVAALPTLVELLLPLVRVGGCAVAWKGADVDAECASASYAVAELGGRLEAVDAYEVPADERLAGSLVVVRKVRPTPDRYPRRPGRPAKRPLESREGR